MAAERVGEHINLEALVASLEGRTNEYINKVSSRVDLEIRNSETADLLEIRVFTRKWDGETGAYIKDTLLYTERPEFPVNSDWAKLLYKYMREKSIGENRIMEAGIEKVVADAVYAASEEFFAEEAMSTLSDAFVEQINTNKKLQEVLFRELKAAGKLAKREIKDIIATNGSATMASQLHNTMAGVVHTAMGTTVGHSLLAALMTPAAKMAIIHAVNTAAGHALLQHLLHLGIKKIGITIMLTVAFGSAGAAAGAWIAAPIIVGIMAWQYYHLPEKFAEEMAPAVAKVVREKAPEIYRNVTEAYKGSLLTELFKATGNKGVEEFRSWALGPAN